MNAQQREAIRYCEDCKWFRLGNHTSRSSQLNYAKCGNPLVNDDALVSREMGGTYCESERNGRAGFFGNRRCGRQGRLWESK